MAGEAKKCLYLYSKTVYGKLKCVYGIIRGIYVNKFLLSVPCQFLGLNLGNITVLFCCSKNFILILSNQTLALLSDYWKERELVLK